MNKVTESYRAGGLVDIPLTDSQQCLQKLEHRSGDAFRDFQPRAEAVLAIFQHIFHFRQQVRSIIITDCHVSVAGDAEWDRGNNSGSGEESRDQQLNCVFRQNEFISTAARQGDVTQIEPTEGDHGKPERFIFAASQQLYGEVQGPSEQQWKPGGIMHCDGCQNRLQLFMKDRIQEFQLSFRQLIGAAPANPGFRQRGFNLLQIDVILLRSHLLCPNADCHQLFQTGHPGGVRDGVSCADGTEQTAHPHHEEFVEV